jgi:hypothetical protein
VEENLQNPIPNLIISPELEEYRRKKRLKEEAERHQELTPPMEIKEGEEDPELAQSRLNGYLQPRPLGKPSLSSYIAPEDEQEARELIRKLLGFEPVRATGFYMLVSIYVRPHDVLLDKDGKATKIVRAETIPNMDQYRRSVALVLDFGPLCWKHPTFAETGPSCRIGDWIIITRGEGQPYKERGVPMMLIPDTSCRGVAQDPFFIEEA